MERLTKLIREFGRWTKRSNVWLICGLWLIAFLMVGCEEQQSGFSGLEMGMGNLACLSSAQTRSVSPENFTGEKGKGGMATEGTGARAARELGQGWKVSPSVRIEPGQTFVMANVEGCGAIQHIWMTPTGNNRCNILRMYWVGREALC